MLKTHNTYEREQLEFNILDSIWTQNDLFWEFDLDERFFTNSMCIEIFKYFKKTFLSGQKPDYVKAMAEFNNEKLLSYLKNVNTSLYTPSTSFRDMCEVLLEDYRRDQINRYFENCTSSHEITQAILELQKITNGVKVESFENQLIQYIEKYKIKSQKIEKKEPIGLQTGWHKFNSLVAPEAGNYLVLGARPSVGKTTWGLNLAIESAWLGAKVLFVSVEMSDTQIIDKIFARIIQQPIWKFRFGKIKNISNYLESLDFLKENFTLLNAPQCTSTNIQSVVNHKKFDLIVVDYLQFLNDLPTNKNETETLRIGRISKNLKTIAREKETTVVALAQLNRNAENQKREPVLSDLRDSGCIEQDADVVMLLHRENRESQKAKLLIAKNRIGSTGVIDYDFNLDWGHFKETNI